MRIKPFIAKNTAEAFAIVRQELGKDAVIIDTENLPNGEVKVTAAVEEDDFFFQEDDSTEFLPSRTEFDDSLLRECLGYHGVIPVIENKILSAARNFQQQHKIQDDKKILASCLGNIFAFSDILNKDNRLKLFMGTPGSGKSTAIAKVATLAKFQHLSCCIISTDNVRAGANSQLEAFAKILDTPFYFVTTARELYNLAEQNLQKYDFVLIDTPGINPFLSGEVEKLSLFTEVVKADMLLTMDAGRNPYEAVELADIFCSVGAKFLLPTRMDLTRRIGALLSVAGCCGLTFCSASVSAQIAKGLAEINSQSLAKLILA